MQEAVLTRNEKILCLIYATIAVVALIATWSNNLEFMREPENRNLWRWIDAAYVNHAAASLTNDLLTLALAACVFIVVEGRRLKMRFVWLYVLLSGPIAISVTFPVFLIVRQINLSRRRTQQQIAG